MFKSAADRLRALLKSLRPHLSAVLPPPGDRISEPRHPLVHAIGASSDPIADVRLQDAVPLNAGTCVFRANLEVATDPNSGGYSALVPVLLSDRYSGPVSFRCLLDVRDGAVGISAVTSDCRIIAERAATRTGAQQLEIFVAGSHDVAGILIRNFAVTGRRSRAIIESVSASAWQAENFLRIQRTSRNRILHLPLRKQTGRTDPGDDQVHQHNSGPRYRDLRGDYRRRLEGTRGPSSGKYFRRAGSDTQCIAVDRHGDHPRCA